MASLVDKYIPTTWEDLVGQTSIIKFFKNVIQNPSKFPKNFILNGSRGTGKTSSSRIFVNDLNKKMKTASYEYDVSIINKEFVKEIKDRIDNQFSFSKDYRVLIFDEIQTANVASQSVFLKTLENNILDDNSDRNIYFLFLTTDSSKIINPIKSRCIQLNFLLLNNEDIKKRLRQIINLEGIVITEETLTSIAELSEGHMRDAIILLDTYLIMGDDFKANMLDSKSLLYDFIFINKSLLESIIIFPVNTLIKDLNKIILKYVEDTIDKDFMFVVQFFKLYIQYKYYIKSIEDFMSVIKILQKFIKNKKV